MAVNTKIKLLEKKKLNENVFLYKCLAPEIAKQAKAGQFVELKTTKTYEPFLKRPISIHNIDKENGIIEFIFQVRGRGTQFLSEYEVNDEIETVGPLGDNGFEVKNCKNIAILGGGIGIFPLYELAKENKDNIRINTYLGFRNKDLVLLEDEFKSVSTNLIIATDDGSYGKNGFALDYLKNDFEKEKFDGIFACGPLPLLKRIKEFAESNGIYCQLSLEQRMACGIGACMGCSVKLNTGDDTVKYARVCKDGPVFESNKIDI